MDALLDAAGAAASTLLGAARENARWMGHNALLALAPLVLGAVLVHRRTPRRRLWWLGVGAFGLLLPNAPYVLTDVVHLFDDVRVSRTDGEIVFGILPVYGAFFALGIMSYSACVALVRRTLAARGARHVLAGELAVHAFCAVGIYLGRVHRLNSWDPVVDPGALVDAAASLARPRVLAAVLVLGAALAVVTLATRALVAGARHATRPGLAAP